MPLEVVFRNEIIQEHIAGYQILIKRSTDESGPRLVRAE